MMLPIRLRGSRVLRSAAVVVLCASIAFGAAAPASAADVTLPGVANSTVIYVPGTAPNPWPATTINLGGAGTEFTELLGAATQAVQVGYPASLYPFTDSNMDSLNTSVALGVSSLQAAIAAVATGTPIILVGVSQGDLVLSVEEQALIAAGSTANITFVRVADESSPTGILGRNAGLLLPGVSAVSMPTESPFNQIVVTRQYDGFADFPVDEWNVLADLNAVAGILIYHSNLGYSVDLNSLPASDVTTTVNALGATTTTYFIPSPGLLPLLQVLENAGVSANIVNALQPILKPIVDLGYDQMPLPAVLTTLGQKATVAVVNAAAAASVWTLSAAKGTSATVAAAAKSLSAMVKAAAAAVAAAVAVPQRKPATSVTAEPAAASPAPVSTAASVALAAPTADDTSSSPTRRVHRQRPPAANQAGTTGGVQSVTDTAHSAGHAAHAHPAHNATPPTTKAHARTHA